MIEKGEGTPTSREINLDHLLCAADQIEAANRQAAAEGLSNSADLVDVANRILAGLGSITGESYLTESEALDIREKESVILNDETITIRGIDYPLHSRLDRYLLELILSGQGNTPEQLFDFIKKEYKNTELNSYRIEDKLIDLYKRGILLCKSEKIGDKYHQYKRTFIINYNIAETLKKKIRVVLNDHTIFFLDADDSKIMDLLLESEEPLTFIQLANKLQPARKLSRSEFEALNLTVRSYFYYLGIVKKQPHYAGNYPGFYINSSIKKNVKEAIAKAENS